MPQANLARLTGSRSAITGALEERIALGRELRGNIALGGSGEPIATTLRKWQDYNEELLKRSFTNTVLAGKYRRVAFSAQMGMSNPTPINQRYKNIDAQIAELESILQRLELYPEPSVSESTAAPVPTASEMLGSAMTDAEIRGRLLMHFYGLRDANGGWVPTSEIILSPDQVSRQAIRNACQHLAEAGYIKWEPFNPPIEQHAIGRANITGDGVDVVTGARVPSIDIRFPNMGERDAPVAPASVRKEPPQRLRKQALNQTIRDKVWQQFEHRHYDTAVFEAMKAVEVAVRDAAGLSAADIGTKLMRKAFEIENGVLTDKSAEQGERQARSDLFAGAIGSYKNPHSHRNVPLDDPDEAAEIIMLANHLLRIVDARALALLMR